MTRSSSIDGAARRLLTTIAGTRHARVSARALDHHVRAGKQLLDARLIVRHGSNNSGVAEDELDDTLTTFTSHPINGRSGQLGQTAWQDEADTSLRRVYVLNMLAAARRMLARIDCSLNHDPVPYLDGTVLDFGTARLPRRKARVGIWAARGLTAPRVFEQFRQLAVRRPSEGLRVVIALDPTERFRPAFLKGHEFVALADVVDHEDGLAIHPEILAARLLKGPADKGPVWITGGGGVLVVHGRWHEFTGTKQKIAVRLLAESWLDGNPVQPVARVLEEAECGMSVTRLKDLFGGHPTWREVIMESGSSCWLEA